jgi:hypothetical protein
VKSETLPSFWKDYSVLEDSVKRQARKSYHLWADNPFHPSLHFKCINFTENIWSVRISRGYRALGNVEDDTITWFWIGSHRDYENFFRRLR